MVTVAGSANIQNVAAFLTYSNCSIDAFKSNLLSADYSLVDILI